VRHTAHCGFCELELETEDGSEAAIGAVCRVLVEHLMVIHGAPYDVAELVAQDWRHSLGTETVH
jgi:hypothetical protein